MEAYTTGFKAGVEKVQEQAQEEADTWAITEDERLQYVFEFPKWVRTRTIETSKIFTCDMAINLERPFPEEEKVWSLWANQNCKDFDLLLTVIFDKDAEDSLLGFTGADLSSKGCKTMKDFSTAIACEYELKANGGNFGVLFSGKFAPVYYFTEWKKSSTWKPYFSWWA